MFIKILQITFVATFIIANNACGTQLLANHFSSIKKDSTSTIYADDKEYLDRLREYRNSSQARFNYWNDLRKECEPEDAVYDNVRPKDGPTLRKQYCTDQRNDTFSESSTQSSGSTSIYSPPLSVIRKTDKSIPIKSEFSLENIKIYSNNKPRILGVTSASYEKQGKNKCSIW